MRVHCFDQPDGKILPRLLEYFVRFAARGFVSAPQFACFERGVRVERKTWRTQVAGDEQPFLAGSSVGMVFAFRSPTTTTMSRPFSSVNTPALPIKTGLETGRLHFT